MAKFRPKLLGIAVSVTMLASLSWSAQPGGASSEGVVFFSAALPADRTATSSTSSLGKAPERPAEPHTAETDERLRKADQHLASGKQLYFKGDFAGARREFDSAVDALLNAPDNLVDHRRLERRLDEIADTVYRFDIEKLGAGEVTTAEVFDQAPIDEISNMTFPVDPTITSKVGKELQQTASGIPLELSDPVVSYIHYFSSDRGRKILLGGFRRAGRYKTLIQRILKEEGVPQELIYLAQAESGFLPRAISSANATGMWQFISGTGQLYDLTRTASYDDRFDPEKATRAAARHLKDLHARYGDWYLAMAAYNCGPGNVDRAVERTGYADYWELLKRHALPKETANYVPIIVAMTIMAKNPKDYGLDLIEEDSPIEYENVKLDATTNLSLIADATQQPVSAVKELNPALLGNVAPSGYEVHVPKGEGSVLTAALESIPAENRNSWRLHHVVVGDTLEAISREYGTPAERILAVNRGADSLDAGDVLLIPAVYHPPVVRKTQSRSSRHTRTTTRSSAKTTHVASTRSNRSGRNTRTAASVRSVSPRVLHRRAGVSTASLHR